MASVGDSATMVRKPVAARRPAAARRRGLPLTLVVGGGLVGLIVGIAILSFIWTPYDPLLLNVRARLLPPGSPGFLLGTDKLGRDVVTQIMIGSRNSLYVGVIATSVSLIAGTALGLWAAGASHRWQSLLTRSVDVGVAIPGILIALVIATAIGPGNTAAIIAITLWFVPVAARVVIGPAKQILALDFVEAAFAYGRSRLFVLSAHVLPNIASLLIVQASVMFASAILIEASLSYIGVGAQPPTASWGRTLKEAQPLIDVAPSLMIFPGLAIVIAVLGFNMLGDGLRTILDPKQISGRGDG